MAESHPQWVRRTLCEDLAELDRKAGRLPDTRTIEKVIDRDIQRFEATQREAKPTTLKQRDEIPSDERHITAKREAAERGHRFGHKEQAGDELLQFGCECGGHCKRCKIRVRLLQLIEPVPWNERQPKVEPWLNCRYPALAKEAITALFSWKKQHNLMPQKRAEVNLRFQRVLEDICNRSNSIIGLGEWDA